MTKQILITLAAIAGLIVGSAVAEETTKHYSSPGKPAHPIQVDFDWDNKVAVGEEVPVNVRVHSRMPLQDIRVEARASQGLMLRGQSYQVLEKTGAAGEERVSYHVTPMSEGAHEVVLRISAAYDGSRISREVHLAMPVGEATREKAEPRKIGKTVEAADGVREQRGRARVEIN